ncbi:MAG: hypothetical protein M0021_09695 [Clostridia bacterium]|nr:hypothetical protein [Clostridia bacterium]
MNKRQKGYSRDKAILKMIEEWGVTDAHQVRLMLFFDIQSSQRKSQERLRKLALKGSVNRWRAEEGYLLYSLGDKNAMSAHLEGINWVRVWLEKTKRSWEKVHCFLYEQNYGVLRCDAFVAVKNTVTGQFRFYFIEMDRSPGNKFDKVTKYCQLFRQGGYEDRWWVELTDKFPTILTVTTSVPRKEKILQHIAEENTEGLNFDVRLLRDIREEAMSWQN